MTLVMLTSGASACLAWRTTPWVAAALSVVGLSFLVFFFFFFFFFVFLPVS
jgi:hypothetical protein